MYLHRHQLCLNARNQQLRQSGGQILDAKEFGITGLEVWVVRKERLQCIASNRSTCVMVQLVRSGAYYMSTCDLLRY